MTISKVAAIQMCSSSLLEDNLRHAEQLIAEAALNQAKLIVLPEMFALMGDSASTKVDFKESFGHGKIQNFLAHQARQHKVWIVGGTIPIECSDQQKVRAASLVFDDTGQCVARYDKIHLFDVTLSRREIYRESDTTEPGEQPVLVETPFGKIGLAVCYDVRFPELFRHLFRQGAELFILPAAFTVKTGKAHWEVLARSRAIENLCYFIGSCQGGFHANGRETYGDSMIISPWGEVVSRKDSIEPGVIYASIDLSQVHQCRTSIPIAMHQRID